jgi:hypothetical protein
MNADQEDETAGFSGENSSRAFLIPSFICVHPVHLRFVATGMKRCHLDNLRLLPNWIVV